MIDIRMLLAVLAGALFLGISLIVVSGLKAIYRQRDRGDEEDVEAPPLSQDPKLMAFFARADPQFKKEFPTMAAGAQPAATAPDVDLQALSGLWPRLSVADRRELLAIAKLKLQAHK